METLNRPIITSLLDIDLYKLPMSQLIWKKQRSAWARFDFKNRHNLVNLLDWLDPDEIQQQIEFARCLRLSPRERSYLRGLGLLEDAYITDLTAMRLPEVEVTSDLGILGIRAEGEWWQVTFWETLILSIVTELYAWKWLKRFREGERQVTRVGRDHLLNKIVALKRHPGVKIIEFGTRRRYSAAWQQEVLTTLKQELPGQLLGTSNVRLADELMLRPIGTYAHEMPMGYAAIYGDLRTGIPVGQGKFLDDWYELYGDRLAIALPDTFGTDFFLEHFEERAKIWRGVRIDSGDPIEIAEKVLAFYESHGIDPKQKTVIFSDGLDDQKIVQYYNRFAERTNVLFGWGTTLTNDVSIPTLSLVMKLTSVDGVGTVKLSDNRAKAIGTTADLERAEAIYGYSTNFEQACAV